MGGRKMSFKVAALFVDHDGPYVRRSGPGRVEAWTEVEDARRYRGPYAVIAHPPCKRWGRYWSGGPSAKTRRLKGDDGGCFASALWSVRTFGGVLEHPEASHAWQWFGLQKPRRHWVETGREWPAGSEYACEVDQGAYGHRARKRTWLYYVGTSRPQKLDWSTATGVRLDHGYHSKAERAAAVAAGTHRPIKRLTARENLLTPPRFAAALIDIAMGAHV